MPLSTTPRTMRSECECIKILSIVWNRSFIWKFLPFRSPSKSKKTKAFKFPSTRSKEKREKSKECKERSTEKEEVKEVKEKDVVDSKIDKKKKEKSREKEEKKEKVKEDKKDKKKVKQNSITSEEVLSLGGEFELYENCNPYYPLFNPFIFQMFNQFSA